MIDPIDDFRAQIEHNYLKAPTYCGSSFGEILCWELHSNNTVFTTLAKNWGISVRFLGELIADHCNKL